MGFLYLLHFSASLSGKRSSHYAGYAAKNPEARIEQHRRGTSRATFTDEAARQGIPFQVAGIWPNMTPADERRIKNQKRHRVYCSICANGGRVRSVERTVRGTGRHASQTPVARQQAPLDDDMGDIEDLPW